MKTNTKKIAGYSAMALAAATVLPISCKKDKAVSDDPEIDAITPNLNLSAPSVGSLDSSIVLLGNDIYLTVGRYYSNDVVYIDFDGNSVFQKDNDVTVNGSSWDFLPTLNEGATIDTASAAWLDGGDNDDGYFFVKDNSPAPGASYGINGQGDKFVAFRQGSGSSYKYGWMKVNVSSDGKTFILKEMAMSNVVNKVIKVGAK